MGLATCPHTWHFVASRSLQQISVKGSWIAPKLFIDWGDLIMSNNMSDVKLRLPKQMYINPVKAILAKEIIKESFVTHIILTHHGNAYPVVVCPHECHCKMYKKYSGSVAVGPTAPLYPLLSADPDSEAE